MARNKIQTKVQEGGYRIWQKIVQAVNGSRYMVILFRFSYLAGIHFGYVFRV